MIPARQSTAFELSIGPVLDAAGVAVTDCVVGDFKIKKTTGNYAALNGSATLTHVSAGTYDLVLTTSDVDTVGLATISIDDTVNACAPVRLQVIEEAVYDRDFASASTGIIGTAQTADHTASIAAILVDTGTTLQAELDGIQADTEDIQGRLPAALTADGNMKADALRFGGTLYATALAAEVDAVWDENRLGHVTANSFGEHINNFTPAAMWAAATRTLTSAANITSTGGTTVPQTGDSFARLGAPAGASHAADVAAVKSDTVEILTDTSVIGAAGAGLTGIPAVGSVTGAVGSVTAPVTAGTVSDKTGYAITSNVKKNQALAEFQFLMTDSTTHAPATGKTVTCTRSIDGAGFAAGTLANVTEVANGTYTVDFGAGDLNGNVILLRATATGCDDVFERIITQP